MIFKFKTMIGKADEIEADVDNMEYGTYSYDINVDNVMEAETVEIPQARKITLAQRAKTKAKFACEWLALNWREIISIVTVFLVLLTIYCVNVAFYIKGMVKPEEFTFMNTGLKEGFYTIWMVFFAFIFGNFCVSFLKNIVYANDHIPKPLKVGLCLWFVLLIALPFPLVLHFKHLEYYRICDDYIYDITVDGRTVTFENSPLYTIKSSISNNDNSITITTGPLPGKHDEMATKFGGIDGLVIPYHYKKLDLFNSSMVSDGGNWNDSRARISGMVFMRHPSNDNELKICANDFEENILQITTIVPVLQDRYNTCHSCMNRCMNTCKRWDTRIVPYTYTTCSGTGSERKCTTHTGFRTERYCAEYYSYQECKWTCTSPACIGIKL